MIQSEIKKPNSSYLNCLVCNCNLVQNFLNENEIIMTCESNNCLFPLNCENLSQYILKINCITEEINKLSTFLKEQRDYSSTNMSCIDESLPDNNKLIQNKIINWVDSDEAQLYSISREYNYTQNFFES